MRTKGKLDRDLYEFVDSGRVLAALTRTANELASILALEASGTRDGDGTWHGADALECALSDIEPRLRTLADLYRKVRRDELPF